MSGRVIKLFDTSLPNDYTPVQRVGLLKFRGKFEINSKVRLVHVDELSPFCSIYLLKKEELKRYEEIWEKKKELTLTAEELFQLEKSKELEISLDGSDVEFSGIKEEDYDPAFPMTEDKFKKLPNAKNLKSSDTTKAKILIRTSKTCYFLSGFYSFDDRRAWYQALCRARNWIFKADYVLNEWENSECKLCIDGIKFNQEVEMAKPSEKVEFQEIGLFILEDLQSKKAPLASILKRTTVLVLLRHFGCVLCKRAAAKIKAIQNQLKENRLDVIAIGNGSPRTALNFKKEIGWEFPLFVDQARAIYKYLCCKSGVKYCIGKKTLVAAKDALSSGFRQTEVAGDM